MKRCDDAMGWRELSWWLIIATPPLKAWTTRLLCLGQPSSSICRAMTSLRRFMMRDLDW
jgi:hypothetical protein